MEYYITRITESDELIHYGIRGMRWGVRRYQNKDGSLTEEGRKHVNDYEKLNKLRETKPTTKVENCLSR